MQPKSLEACALWGKQRPIEREKDYAANPAVFLRGALKLPKL